MPMYLVAQFCPWANLGLSNSPPHRQRSTPLGLAFLFNGGTGGVWGLKHNLLGP